MSGNQVTTSIITKGMGIGALNYSFITTHFSLLVTGVQNSGGGGGSYPGPAHNVYPEGTFKNFYKPIQIEQPYHVPLDQEHHYLQPKHNITIRFNIGEKQIEKIYQVNKNKANIVINVINFTNNTRNKINVIINSIKRKVNNARINITKLRKTKNNKQE